LKTEMLNIKSINIASMVKRFQSNNEINDYLLLF
jgi:hypothetical protein